MFANFLRSLLEKIQVQNIHASELFIVGVCVCYIRICVGAFDVLLGHLGVCMRDSPRESLNGTVSSQRSS